MTVLARLARSRGAIERPRVLVVTVNALTQRAPPLKFVAGAAFSAAPGNNVRMEDSPNGSPTAASRASAPSTTSANSPLAAASSISIRPACARSGSISSATR